MFFFSVFPHVSFSFPLFPLDFRLPSLFLLEFPVGVSLNHVGFAQQFLQIMLWLQACFFTFPFPFVLPLIFSLGLDHRFAFLRAPKRRLTILNL